MSPFRRFGIPIVVGAALLGAAALLWLRDPTMDSGRNLDWLHPGDRADAAPADAAPAEWTELPANDPLTLQVWSALRCAAGGAVTEDAALTRAARVVGEFAARGALPTERDVPSLHGRRGVIVPLLPPEMVAAPPEPDACGAGGVDWTALPLAGVRRAGVVVIQRDGARQAIIISEERP